MVNNFGRCIDADISHDENLLDLLIKIVINIGIAAENRINSSYNAVSGLRQTVDKTFEKAYFLLRHTVRLPLSFLSYFFRIVSYSFLFVQFSLNQIDRNKGRNTLLLHRDAVQTVCRRHRTAPVGDDDELGIFCQLVQILRKTRYVGIVERRLDLVK